MSIPSEAFDEDASAGLGETLDVSRSTRAFFADTTVREAPLRDPSTSPPPIEMLTPEEMDPEQLISRLAAMGRDKLALEALTSHLERKEPDRQGPEHRVREIRALLETVIEIVNRELRIVLRQTDGVLSERAQRMLHAHLVRLYTMADIGKGFSVLVHTLQNILQVPGRQFDANRLRLFRDTLERLYGDPRMSHEHAWTLRKDLERAGLQVQDRELRTMLVDAIMSAHAEDAGAEDAGADDR